MKLTGTEIKELNFLKSRGLKYITRDKKGEIFAFEAKPVKYGLEWKNGNRDEWVAYNPTIFAFLKWEDENPTLISELLGEEIKKEWLCTKCGGNIFLFEATRTGKVIFDDSGEMENLSEHDEFDYTVRCKKCGNETQGFDDEEMQKIAELKEVAE